MKGFLGGRQGVRLAREREAGLGELQQMPKRHARWILAVIARPAKEERFQSHRADSAVGKKQDRPPSFPQLQNCR